jgi:hypothetical protein
MSDTLQLVVNAPYIQPGRIETAQASGRLRVEVAGKNCFGFARVVREVEFRERRRQAEAYRTFVERF